MPGLVFCLQETVKREVHIEIPDVLKRVLEEDFVAIHKHGKVICINKALFIVIVI